MGSEGKSRKRRSSPSSSSDEDGDARKTRKRDDGERKIRKEEKSKRRKSHKSSRSSDGKEKKSGEKHKRSRKKRPDSFVELSKDDYFAKNNEFSTWLKEEKGIFFSELSSEAARELFSSFIKDWNNQKLQSRYYEGIASGPRTAHVWKIKT